MPPSMEKNDGQRGSIIPSTRTLGVARVVDSAAVRGGLAKDLDGTTFQDRINQAITTAQTDAGTAHPNDPTLPLFSVTAGMFDDTRAVTRASYRYIPGLSTPTQEAWKTYNSRTGTRQLRYYSRHHQRDANNRPDANGPANFILPVLLNKVQWSLSARPFQIKTEHLYFQTVLDADPRPDLSPLIDTVNSASVSISGLFRRGVGGAVVDPALDQSRTFGAHQLWFHGFQTNPVETADGLKWPTVMHCEHTEAPGFVQEDMLGFGSSVSGLFVVGAVSVSSFAVIVRYVFPRKIGDLTGKLPVHTPPA